MNDYRVIYHKDSERKKHKYVARVETGKLLPKYRYFYDAEEYKLYLSSKQTTTNTNNATDNGNTKKNIEPVKPNLRARITRSVQELKDNGKKSVENLMNKTEAKVTEVAKDTADKAITTAEKIANESPKYLNKVVDKAKEIGNKIYDDPDNIYDVNRSNYDEKIEKVKQTPEWKEIVASGNPEYVKKNADGSTSYLIDDYLMKKKRPLLDIADDIVNNRPISLNKVEKDAVVAGLKQQVFGKITLGMIAVGAASKVLMEAGKVSQGSYNEEIENMYKTIDTGKDYINTFTSTTNSISDEDVEKVLQAIQTTRKVTEVEAAAKKISEDDIVTAAKILMQSDKIPENVQANEYYQLAESTLTGLSEEEIIMLNVLLNSMRNK